MGNKKLLLYTGLAGMLTLCLFTGCVKKKPVSSENPTVSTEVINSEQTFTREDTALWKNKTVFDKVNQLYHVGSSIDFSSGIYTSLKNFNNTILIYGTDTSGYEFEQACAMDAYFMLYDPITDSITAQKTINMNESTSYQVVENRIFMRDGLANTIAIYNEKLEKLGTYDASSISDFYMMNPFYCRTTGEYYAAANSKLYKLEFKDGIVSATEIDAPLYSMQIMNVSDDGKTLVLCGVDKQTFRYNVILYDPVDGETLLSCPSENYAYSDGYGDTILAQYSSINSIYSYETGDDLSYFITKGGNAPMVLENGSIYISNQLFDDDYSSYVFQAHMMQASTTSASLDIVCGLLDNGITQSISYTEALLPDYECMFYLLTQDDATSLLMWNYKDASAPDSITLYSNYNDALLAVDELYPQEESFGQTVSLITHPENYDWGDLTDCQAYADTLEDEYGIEIFIGPEVPGTLADFTCAQVCDSESVMDALTRLSDNLAYYPDNFFRQLLFGKTHSIHIYIAGELKGNSEYSLEYAGGFVTDQRDYLIMVLDSAQDWSEVFHHELSHMIDKRLLFENECDSSYPLSEEAWASLNPADFSYQETYTDFYYYSVYENCPHYFVSSYSTTFPTEDRAELFANAMEIYICGEDSYYIYPMKTNEGARKKMEFYCEAIRAGFDTTGWDDVMPWEKCVQE